MPSPVRVVYRARLVGCFPFDFVYFRVIEFVAFDLSGFLWHKKGGSVSRNRATSPNFRRSARTSVTIRIKTLTFLTTIATKLRFYSLKSDNRITSSLKIIKKKENTFDIDISTGV